MEGTSFRLIGNRVLVKMKEVEEQINGIYLPEVAKEKQERQAIFGEIVAKGKDVSLEVKSQKCILKRYVGEELTIDGKLYKIVSPDDILAIVED